MLRESGTASAAFVSEKKQLQRSETASLLLTFSAFVEVCLPQLLWAGSGVAALMRGEIGGKQNSLSSWVGLCSLIPRSVALVSRSGSAAHPPHFQHSW